MMSKPRISVIINTLDRAPSLDLLLDSLGQLTYLDFEVVVVVGPCKDHTDAVLSARCEPMKLLRCDAPNLSKSRNIGIAASAADFVAFIDDDAVPEPQWLDELLAGFYESDGSLAPDVAAVGGWVYDHTGHEFQCTHTGADRLGNALPDYPRPLNLLATPGSRLFPYAPGGNALYRRDVLIAMGGFDEEYEYYLEETDLSARLIDHGWAIRQVDGGAIHHKFLPSSVRTSSKVLRDRYAVVKNKIYFSFVVGSEYHTMTEIMSDNARFADTHKNDVAWHLERENMTPAEAESSLASIDRAWSAGLAAAERGRAAMGFSKGQEPPAPRPFLPFQTRQVKGRRFRLCFVSQTIPPEVIGGIGRYFMDLARELASRGHEIHVITTAQGHDTVDLEEGVWVHRIGKDFHGQEVPTRLEVPHRIAANATAVAAEVERITDRVPLDAVYAAMWDVEHLAVMAKRSVPCVTALVTTFAITLRTRPEWVRDATFMGEFGTPLLELERWVLEHSDVVHAISNAIAREVQATSGVVIESPRLHVEPIGEADHFSLIPDRLDRESCTLLFVGRFEKRKGIDLLFETIPEVLESQPKVSVVLAGRNDLRGENGRTYGEVFLERNRGAPWLDRVSMLGVVDDERLWSLLAEADVLVAPSRFESFGLVYLEGMMAGLPVVALDMGAAPEIIKDGTSGLLVAADSASLAEALLELCADPNARERIGAAGRRRYEELYTVAAMADGAERIFSALPVPEVL